MLLRSCQRSFLRTLPFALALCCCACATVGQAADRVYPHNDAPASGKITSLSPVKVVINVRGKDQTFDMADVQKIAFDGEPRELERARDQFLNGQYDQALDEIKKVNAAGVSNPVIRQEVEFYRWYCEGKMSLSGEGDKSAAIQGLRAIASANRNTHHLFDVGEMLGELHLAIGKPTEAAQFFSVLLKATDDTTKARGVYRLGLVELAEDKNDEALTRFSQLVSAPSSSAEMTRLKNLAKVGMAVCDERAGDLDGAQQKLQELVDQTPSSDAELFARIKNAQGACFVKQDQPVQALLSYLQTDLLFFSASEAHAEALYHLQDLWKQYGNAAKAADAKQRLETQYASTIWANR